MEYPSKIVGDTVEAFRRLPGIGRKTAIRMVLHLLRQEASENKRFGDLLNRLSTEVTYCQQCHNISDEEICSVCRDRSRDQTTVCIVEDVRDVMAIENTNQYRGTYHVLGGLISPMDGIGPEKLELESLFKRVETNDVSELIFALSSTMEGDTTMFFISKKLSELNIKVSTISRGIAVGGELEYADEVTLARSIAGRVPYNGQ